MAQTQLSESQDRFLQEMAILVSHLSTMVSSLNEQKNNLYTIINILSRIEDKIDFVHNEVKQDEKIDTKQP